MYFFFAMSLSGRVKDEAQSMRATRLELLHAPLDIFRTSYLHITCGVHLHHIQIFSESFQNDSPPV